MQSCLSHNPLGQVPQLSAQRRVHQAFRWLHLHDGLLMDWQRTLVGIPAPPFGEGPRAAWLLEQFRSLGLSEAGIDEEGNVIGLLPASAETAPNVAHNPRVVVLSAHIDTVFPHGTDVTVQTTGSRLVAPGACDNAAGVFSLP
jgi:tripeptide aminopeptidase